jgi:hypothetical protein
MCYLTIAPRRAQVGALEKTAAGVDAVRKLKHLPVNEWPEADRDAFRAAYEPGDVFDETAGPGAHHSPGAREMIEIGYRRWLGYLKANCPEDLSLPPAGRIKPQRVRSFIEHISTESKPSTVALAVHLLHGAAKLIDPNKGTCNNFLSLRRDELEAKVLNGLRHQLMRPDMVRTFIDEFQREVNRQASEQDLRHDRARRDLEKTEREIRRLIEAIKAGVSGDIVKGEMATLETRRSDLLGQLEAAPPPTPRLHPGIAEIYRQKIVNLGEALNDERTRTEAAACIRELIEEIRLVPEKGKLRIEVFGKLSALINLGNKNPRSGGRTGAQVTLVTGARNQRCLHLDHAVLQTEQSVLDAKRVPLTPREPAGTSLQSKCRSRRRLVR